jgi:hypothetical protein
MFLSLYYFFLNQTSFIHCKYQPKLVKQMDNFIPHLDLNKSIEEQMHLVFGHVTEDDTVTWSENMVHKESTKNDPAQSVSTTQPKRKKQRISTCLLCTALGLEPSKEIVDGVYGPKRESVLLFEIDHILNLGPEFRSKVALQLLNRPPHVCRGEHMGIGGLYHKYNTAGALYRRYAEYCKKHYKEGKANPYEAWRKVSFGIKFGQLNPADFRKKFADAALLLTNNPTEGQE